MKESEGGGKGDGLQVYTSEKQAVDVYMVFMQRDRGYQFQGAELETARSIKEKKCELANYSSWLQNIVAHKALHRKEI